MKKEEQILLIVKPQYGFGEKDKAASGDAAAVPPNATLNVNLELISWKSVSNITDDKKVTKMILKEGDGFEKPNEGVVVKLKLTGKLGDGTVFVKKGHGDSEDDLFEFKTNEEQVIEGLDRAVVTMKKGEIGLLTISPEYAFGSVESKQELASMNLRVNALDKTKFYVVGAGIFTGITVALYPISVVKTRLQVPSKDVIERDAISVFKSILKTDGVTGLYRGFGTVITGAIPTRILFLAALETTKVAGFKMIEPFKLHEPTRAAIANGIAGMSASLCSQAIFVPIDVAQIGRDSKPQ